jgi:hypothetical protein
MSQILLVEPDNIDALFMSLLSSIAQRDSTKSQDEYERLVFILESKGIILKKQTN